MIVVYPIIVSKTISPNILPGVCKSLERYILVYKLDELMDRINQELAVKSKKAKRKRMMKVLVTGRGKLQLQEADYSDLYEQGSSTNTGTNMPGARVPGQYDPGDPDWSKYSDIYNKDRPKGTVYPMPKITRKPGGKDGQPPSDKGGRLGNVNLAEPKGDALTVEPTWVKVDTETEGSKVIGVKVVPFISQSDASLLRLMADDRYRTQMSTTLHWNARRSLKLMYRMANKLWKYSIGIFSFTGFVSGELVSSTIGGDIKNDVILGRTKFEKNMFIMVNKEDFKDSFFKDPKGIKKLFGLFWPSIIAADEVNKTIFYCMDEFKGLCSQVNYAYLYTINRQTKEAYDTIEDVRRSSGPLFRMSGRLGKMINDQKAQDKLLQYSKESLLEEETLEEKTLLVEDLKEFQRFMKPMKPKQLMSTLKDIQQDLKNKNFKSLKSKLSIFDTTGITIDKLERKAMKASSDFSSMNQRTKMALKNSLPGSIPDDILRMGSLVITMKSLLSKDPKRDNIDNIKKVVAKVRAVGPASQSSDDWDREILYAFVFGVFTVGIIGVFGFLATKAVMSAMVVIAPSIAGTASMIFAIIMIIGAVMIVSTLGGALGWAEPSSSKEKLVTGTKGNLS